VPDLGHGFTVEDNNTSTIPDLKTLKEISTVKTGKDPDSSVSITSAIPLDWWLSKLGDLLGSNL
jgi:hypothetical protein